MNFTGGHVSSLHPTYVSMYTCGFCVTVMRSFQGLPKQDKLTGTFAHYITDETKQLPAIF